MMVRNRVKTTREDWNPTPVNEDYECNRGWCWKYNKNVPLWKRKAFRGKIHKENVERTTDG